ncbi:putative CDP-diacylglycerol--inositol 3-phosphatidyltransferase [Monocercomonoides exilis]|uniref:putative CDP-diacylglycerol--inositol 3-phosphatidyltransferase n=1 Tax=Monocercomonoides exilis TaxID=2049356 RepID=UPI00355AC170|nr:putative CDP-diacylglycerol--inositol 3-phosphatidyltransferase [Monocercomonoides exilis]|eukprot:MONOS_129.1-p1 / transcript=MONOS_129.1 / gene=MONOS_129 / organism=Monocercomonoides_exilis_PA203 / gene_product=CDP-diacylglycerol--inositol 3-phosphatidyltransferase [EC:2.7.8.11] / transcript_product=CDP-diacylglycerol--inositol 3-phosphatidyltransferase [EC:2.7.8.11] / location=Mono_scaffold00002:245841-246852(+) / protein_length=255 / sequence_SO=supercontig / SO=protein_coding / is_pseudo=false
MFQMGKVHIVWYIPNIIGYIRIILSFISCLAFHRPIIFVTCYLTAFILDWADGFFARRYNQCSQFGALLDIVLASMYPQLSAACSIAAFLDLTSHFVRVYYTLYTHQLSHKKVTSKHSPKMLNLYYSNRMFMGMICVSHEVFLLLLYILYFVDFLLEPVGGIVRKYLQFEQGVHGIKSLFTRSITVSSQFFGHDLNLTTSLLPFSHILCVVLTSAFSICFVLMLMKVLIHVLQLLAACRDLAEYEENEKEQKSS